MLLPFNEYDEFKLTNNVFFDTLLLSDPAIKVKLLMIIQQSSYWIYLPSHEKYHHKVSSPVKRFDKKFASIIANATTSIKVFRVLPALKPIAIYFPQYHPFTENDRFWGINFTEWTLLKPCNLSIMMKPLSLSEGGLGYYDLRDRKIREKQSQLAKSVGIYGFMYYHYWFSGPKSPTNHKVMYEILELMLLDGEPNIKFFFSWANEPWTKTWDGMSDKVLLSQEYGDHQEWTSHFNYLLPFFKHKNYILIDGKPAFAIYRMGHFIITIKEYYYHYYY